MREGRYASVNSINAMIKAWIAIIVEKKIEKIVPRLACSTKPTGRSHLPVFFNKNENS